MIFNYPFRYIIILVWLFCLYGIFSSSLFAAELFKTYPSKPIRLVVPFPAGSGTDILARGLSKELGESLKQPIVVDNRPGASTIIGTDLVAKSLPDGYTLVLASNNHAINQALFTQLPFDPIRDFSPVGQIAVLPFILVVNSTFPVNNVRELVEYIKLRSNQLNYASTGNGTPPHVAMEVFKQQASIEITHVPYKGSADAIFAVLSGSVPVMFANSLSVLPQIQSGKLRAIAVGSPSRIVISPELPTIAESGYPGFDVNLWAGILAPANTPKDIILKLNTEISKVLSLPSVKNYFLQQGAEVKLSSPEQFSKFISEEVDRLGNVAKNAKMRLD